MNFKATSICHPIPLHTLLNVSEAICSVSDISDMDIQNELITQHNYAPNHHVDRHLYRKMSLV